MKTKKSIVCFFLFVLLVEDNILYEKFLQWLLDVDNYELFIRIKKFVSSINSIVPPSDPYNREEQYALNPPIRARTMRIARDIRVFVNEALSGIDLSDDQKQLYPRYLRKLIMVMCYNKVGCLCTIGKKDPRLPSRLQTREERLFPRALSRSLAVHHVSKLGSRQSTHRSAVQRILGLCDRALCL